MSRNTRVSMLFVACALFALVMAMSATAAYGLGPAGPTLSVSDLQQKIDGAGGTLNGYLKTVLKGSTVETIPVEVLAVTSGYGDGPVDMSSLILFRATGEKIDKIGGIAAGMSGSPIYVDVDGTDTLIGALSYGDIFTKDGTGLATPIDAMVSIQNLYLPTEMPRSLVHAVSVDGTVKTDVIIASSTDTAPKADGNTIVVKPLSAVFIGGLNPRSAMYKTIAGRLAARGVDVVPTAGGLSSVESSYNADFEGGSAVAVLAARGDLWIGGVGTVTYVDTHTVDPTVLAFGHSAFWTGASSLFMSNAWVDGVWPSTIEPYKLARPAAVRGTITQDRLAGVMGVDGQLPQTTSVLATATNTANGLVATTSVEIPRKVANDSSGDFYGVPQMAAYVAGTRVFDSWSTPGSAVCTTTVTVSDGLGHEWTIARTSHVSDGWDVLSVVVNDVDDIVSSLQDVNANGIAHADIISVGLESSFFPERNEAEIADVTVLGGVRHGLNTARVSFLKYGEPATQTVDVTFTVPANVPVTGKFSVQAVNYGGGGYESAEDLLEEIFGFMSYNGTSIDRRTVADVVDQLNNTVDNTVIRVTFRPEAPQSDDEEDESGFPVEAVTYDPIKVDATTPWVVSGDVEKTAPVFNLRFDRSLYSYGSQGLVLGEIEDVDGRELIRITGLGSPKITYTVSGMFFWPTPLLYHNAIATFSFAGNEDVLPVAASRVVRVSAKVLLAPSKTSVTHGKPVVLTARVYPANTGGSVSFQILSGSYWRTLKTTALPSTGVVTFSYTPAKAGSPKLRARFLGSANNAAANSHSVTLTVK